MAYLNPRYNGRVGVYRVNEIERFGSVPANVFTAGPLGGIVFIPFNKSLIPAPVSSANVSRYSFLLLQTPNDQRSNINYTAGVPRNVGFAIDGANYDIFDFAAINPTINILSWQAGYGVYEYDTGGYVYEVVSYAGSFYTFSGTEVKTPINVTPAAGRQIMSFNIKGTASFTFAPFVNITGVSTTQAKAFFYNYTTTEVLTYVGSYSTAGLFFRNYSGAYLP